MINFLLGQDDTRREETMKMEKEYIKVKKIVISGDLLIINDEIRFPKKMIIKYSPANSYWSHDDRFRHDISFEVVENKIGEDHEDGESKTVFMNYLIILISNKEIHLDYGGETTDKKTRDSDLDKLDQWFDGGKNDIN